MRPIGTSRLASSQSGYALVTLVFLTTLMLLAAVAAAPNIITQGRREREKEMIWRGNQYVRAVKMYYRKNGRFPTSLDDLTKQKTPGIRYLRQAYKDPMNPEDGAWRLIYVGPAGQLIGSLKPRQNLQLPTGGPAQVGTPAGSLNGPAPGAPGGSAQGPGSSPGQPQGQGGAQPNQGQPGTGTMGEGTSGATDDQGGSAPASGQAAGGAAIIGGNIIGVGSKMNRRSIIVYDKATNYRQFEFIWDPSKDAAATGGQPPQIGTPAGQPGGRVGEAPGPVTPPVTPPTENPNSPQ